MLAGDALPVRRKPANRADWQGLLVSCQSGCI